MGSLPHDTALRDAGDRLGSRPAPLRSATKLDPMRALEAEGGVYVPHVIAWNLTKRCNLECAHCYIAAGSWRAADNELGTEECHRILDEILALNPSPMVILTGGEPLIREDLEAIVEHGASAGATVVVGTNGTRLSDGRIESLMNAGLQGVALSVDSLDPRYHDRFRHGAGALSDTLAAVERLRAHELDFVVQTTVTKGNRAELRELATWAESQGAVAFNLYFVVATGRGEKMPGLSPEENDDVLVELLTLEKEFRGRMLVRSKCQPQLMRHVAVGDAESPLTNYGTRCPCGVQYCRITPEGKVTPCPFMPVVAGDLREQDFASIWTHSPVLHELRGGALSGRCGRCEFRKVCGGCRARAFASSGDYLGPDESCSYDPLGDVPLVEPSRGIAYGAPAAPEMEWTADARERMRRIPSFVRGVVTARVETFARERGRSRIDVQLLDEVRESLPVDFSKRLPFFMRRDP